MQETKRRVFGRKICQIFPICTARLEGHQGAAQAIVRHPTLFYATLTIYFIPAKTYLFTSPHTKLTSTG